MSKGGKEILKFAFVLGVAAIIVGSLINNMDTSATSSYGPITHSPVAPTPAPATVLRLESWRNERSSTDYMKVVGEVTNLTSSPIDKIQAVVKWYDKDKNLIVSDSTLIDYQPLMGNQSSPFHVLSRYNPAMASVEIDFKKFWGDAIGYEVKEKPAAPSKKKGKK